MSIQVRESSYRGQPGFLVSGHDTDGRYCRIFTESRNSAEIIRAKVKKNLDITLEDFRERKLLEGTE